MRHVELGRKALAAQLDPGFPSSPPFVEQGGDAGWLECVLRQVNEAGANELAECGVMHGGGEQGACFHILPHDVVAGFGRRLVVQPAGEFGVEQHPAPSPVGVVVARLGFTRTPDATVSRFLKIVVAQVDLRCIEVGHRLHVHESAKRVPGCLVGQISLREAHQLVVERKVRVLTLVDLAIFDDDHVGRVDPIMVRHVSIGIFFGKAIYAVEFPVQEDNCRTHRLDGEVEPR